MHKSILLNIILSLNLLFLPIAAQAADTDVKKANNIVCGSGGVDLPGCSDGDTYVRATGTWIPNAIVGFIAFTGIAAVILIMIAGVMYIMSMGNDEKEKKARKIIYYALVGLIIAILAYVIVQLVVNLQFGANQSPS